MPREKDCNTLYDKAVHKLAENSLNDAANLFEEAAENTFSSKEKIKALTEALYIYIRPIGIFSFHSAARISKKISILMEPISPKNASLYKKIEEYYTKLQQYVDNEESNILYEPLLIKIKDCFLQMENFFATALVFNNLGTIALHNFHKSEQWKNKQIHYFRESAYLFEELKIWNEAGETYKSVGFEAQKQKKIGVMEDCFLKAAECFIKNHQIKEAAKCYTSLYSENGVTDINKRLTYAMLSIEYSIVTSDVEYLKMTIQKTIKLIEKEDNPQKRKDFLVLLANLAIKGEEYSQAAELYENILTNTAYKIPEKEKKEFREQIPDLLEKQKLKDKKQIIELEEKLAERE